jgi:hypothetical protein
MMQKLTASNLLNDINALDKSIIYDYPNPKTKTKIKIIAVEEPEGPIFIKRWNPFKLESESEAKQDSISAPALRRLASAIKSDAPINMDRVFGASYNIRSALEALLLHTPTFYLCYPGRIETQGDKAKIKAGHKHIICKPESPHALGIIKSIELSGSFVAEMDRELVFDSLSVKSNEANVDIEIERRHAQIQIMLVKIAESMGLKSWVAKNDHSITYGNKKLIEFESVLKSLDSQPAIMGYPKSPKAGELIDIIWFDKEGKKIPAIIEIEHSTGVTSGLTRMKGFKDESPDLAHMTYIIAAPDEIRDQVMKKSSKPQFQSMNIKYLSYSAIEDFYFLCQRQLKGIDNIKFFHTFLEDINN